MISEEKASHIVHLMLDGLERERIAEFKDKERAIREARKVLFSYIKEMNSLGGIVEKRIESQKNAPPAHSPQWEILYSKYYEEEVRKRGG